MLLPWTIFSSSRRKPSSFFCLAIIYLLPVMDFMPYYAYVFLRYERRNKSAKHRCLELGTYNTWEWQEGLLLCRWGRVRPIHISKLTTLQQELCKKIEIWRHKVLPIGQISVPKTDKFHTNHIYSRADFYFPAGIFPRLKKRVSFGNFRTAGEIYPQTCI